MREALFFTHTSLVKQTFLNLLPSRQEIKCGIFGRTMVKTSIWLFFLSNLTTSFSSEGGNLSDFVVVESLQADRKDSLANPLTVLREHLRKNQYLKPLVVLQESEAEYIDSPLKESYLETVILLNSYLGEYSEAYRYEEMLLSHFNSFNNIRERNRKEIKSSQVDSLAMISAVAFIASQAQDQQVIMINEEHRHSLHRGFLLKLLPTLYEKGFRYFAAETFSSKDNLLNKRGYPVQESGYYTSDPVFSKVVRMATTLGYENVAYEYEGEIPSEASPEEQQEIREKGQAENLINRVLQKDPLAKIIVFAGRAHIAEVRTPSFGFMAWHFKELSGIDPYTIDQTQLSERFSVSDEPAIYRYLVKDREPDEPVVFITPDMNGWSGSEFYDLRILHPRSQNFSEHTSWLDNQDLEDISLFSRCVDLKEIFNDKNFSGLEPLEIQVYRKGDTEDAVPLDIVLVKPGQKPRSITLGSGTFLLKVRDITGEVIAEGKVEI